MSNIDEYHYDFQCTPRQYHAAIDKLWTALGVTGVQREDCFTMAANEIVRLRATVKQLESDILEINKAYGCEVREPYSTIWDHAAKLQAENDELRKQLGLPTTCTPTTEER